MGCVAGVTMVKDEADVIGGTLRHMADEVDVLVVADNGSTDDTRKIIEEFADEHAGRVLVVDDPEVGYYQSQKMTLLADLAHAEFGAQWVLPFDADELWVFQGDRISGELGRCDADIVTADLFNHFPSAVDPAGDDPFETIQWRQRQPAPIPKVAFRWEPGCVIHQGNHGVTRPSGGLTSAGLRVLHFSWRSVEQFIRKARNGAAAYKATDLPSDAGAHWRSYGELLERYGEDSLREVFTTHFWALSPADKGWLLDPAPYMRWRTASQ